MKKLLALSLLSVSLLAFQSCKEDDMPMDTMSQGKEALITFKNIAEKKDFVQSGTFMMTGTEKPIILPGESVNFKFNAAQGQRLQFVTMYGLSTDAFFAPENPGIALYTSAGKPITGDVSSQIKLWDNGSRINQKPGMNIVRPAEPGKSLIIQLNQEDAEGNKYLPASKLMQLTLDYDIVKSEFTLTLKNISGGTINETAFSPGVWAISNVLGGKLLNDSPFFKAGEVSSKELTALAETGNNEPLATKVKTTTGIITGLSPVVVVVYTGTVNPIFTVNQKDAGMGLKDLAQKGDSKTLVESLKKMPNVKNVYIAGTAPVGLGETVSTKFQSEVGDQIAYATMFGYSNDWFYAHHGVSASFVGDLTAKTLLFNHGSAMDQYPGAGNGQALFKGTSHAESTVITQVDSKFPVPSPAQILKVSIESVK